MPDTPDQEAAPKKKPVVLIIILANVLLGGGAAAFFMLRGGDTAAAAPEAGPATPTPTASAVGPIVTFNPVIVNLNEPEGTRYLKTSIAVQLVNDKVSSEVDRLKPVIQDHFIRELSELNFRQTMGSKNKLAIKRRLLKRFNEAVGMEAGVEIHLTEFIVQ